jgi:acetyl esterase
MDAKGLPMLHPQARALLDLIEERKIPPAHTLEPAEARIQYRERRHFTQPTPPPVALVRELAAESEHGSVPLRLYYPSRGTGESAAAEGADEALPVLVYFHGGGWLMGDLDTHDTLCRELANGAGCAVVSVDYRMGPEHRFPAAVDDSLAAVYWVRQHAAELGVDAARIAVGGDSAGGNLAAVVAIAARDAQDLPLMFQLLIYPATDMRRTAPSHKTNGQGYLLTADTMTYFHDHYITDPAHDFDWRASPLLRDDLENLPPALVLVAGFDPLHDEGLMFAQRLSEAGNQASLISFERQIHGFVLMGKVIDEANTAVALCAAQLARAFNAGR